MKIGIILATIFIPACVMAVFSSINKSKIATSKKISDEQFIVMIPQIVMEICCCFCGKIVENEKNLL